MYTMNLRRATASPWRAASASLLQKCLLVDRQAGRGAEGLGCGLWAFGPASGDGWVSRPGRAGWVPAPTCAQPALSLSGRPAGAGVEPSRLPWRRCSQARRLLLALGEAALRCRLGHGPGWQGARGLCGVPALTRGPPTVRPLVRGRAARGAKGTRWRPSPERQGSDRPSLRWGRCLVGWPWL
jgi:hypothetical protein